MSDDDYLKTADVWTVLDRLRPIHLVVDLAEIANRIRDEWGSDDEQAAGVDALLPLVARLAVLVEARRKQSAQEQRDAAFTVFSQAFADYMRAIGFDALVAANPRVRGFEGAGIGRFLFELEFTGTRTKKPPSTPPILLLPGNGDVH